MMAKTKNAKMPTRTSPHHTAEQLIPRLAEHAVINKFDRTIRQAIFSPPVSRIGVGVIPDLSGERHVEDKNVALQIRGAGVARDDVGQRSRIDKPPIRIVQVDLIPVAVAVAGA